jgi:hypothetical protein
MWHLSRKRDFMKIGSSNSMTMPLIIAMLVWLAPIAARATPISYQGSIFNNIPVTGSVGGFGMVDDDASSVDFWTFTGSAGSLVTFQGTRLNAGLDLVLSLYFGTTTTDAVLFRHDASFGGMTLVGMGDDEVAPPGGLGPFGDPLLRLILPSTGTYTIAIGGFASDANGPYGYRLAASVPTPATLPLVLTSIVIAYVVRRRSGSRRRNVSRYSTRTA